MAETLRTYDQAIALLLENDTGEISAQDLKDALFSLTQAWAGLARLGASGQDLNGTEKIGFNQAANGDVVMADAGTDKITIPTNGAGYYKIEFGASVELEKVSAIPEMQLKVYKNGAEITGEAISQPKVRAPSDMGVADCQLCLSGGGIVLLADDDYIELYAVASSGGSTTITLRDAHLIIRRLQ